MGLTLRDMHMHAELLNIFSVRSFHLTRYHGSVCSLADTQVAPDDAISATLTRCWEENQYTLCPHTATAAHYHYTHLR